MVRSVLRKIWTTYKGLPFRDRIAILTILVLSPLGFPWQLYFIRTYAECGSFNGLASRCELGPLSEYFYTIEGYFFLSCYAGLCLVWAAITIGLFFLLGLEIFRVIRGMLQR